MVKITTLIENKKGEHLGLEEEHGLSFFIEVDNKKLIFDTGKTDAFLKNAEKLQINLSEIDEVILSHGHYDHTGGVKSLVKKLGKSFSLYAHEDIFVKKYKVEKESMKFLGNDFDKEWLVNNNVKVNSVKEDVTKVTDKIYIVTNFDRVTKFEKNNPIYKVENVNDYIIDDFHDEVSVVIQTAKGLVVVLGCSHPGIVNILKTIIKRFGNNIHTIIGGTHLVGATLERIKETIEFINENDIKCIGVSHCTGLAAVLEFEKTLGDRYFYNCTGMILDFD